MPSRNILIGGVVAVGLVGVCLCVVLVIMAALGFVLYNRATPTAIAPTPSSIDEQMNVIEQWVIGQRGWQPTGPVTRAFLSVEEVKQRTLNDFNEDTTPGEWADSVRVLSAFGVVPPDIDLYDLLLRLYSEGISGFYDPDTHELVLVSETGGLNAYERVTFAHEYNHALQDQNYDLRGAMGFSDEGWDTDPQRAAAAQALLEGDSTLMDEQYKDTLTRAEQREYDRVLNSFDVSIYSELPEALFRDFAFPYLQGADFVKRYYRLGGWARVNEVWQDPPLSTEHILHPERYERGDNPMVLARPALTDTLGAGWRLMEASVNGEWGTFLILAYGVDEAARLSEKEAQTAVEGWGGDDYVAYFNEARNETVLAQHWVWDTPEDADEFNRAFTQYANARFGKSQTDNTHTCWDNGVHCLYVNGAHSLWLIAPDAETMDTVLSQYPDLQ